MKTPAQHSMSWQISLIVPAFALDFFEKALEHIFDVLSTQVYRGDWLIRGYVEARPNRKKIVAILASAAMDAGIQPPVPTIELLPPINWVRKSIQNLKPVQIGRFVIRGSHSKVQRNPSLIELVVDAGAAFGTAHHATTQGCLLALSKLAPSLTPSHPLDLGCGAGTLAMATAQLWKVKVIAADIDPVAVQVTRRNTTVNGLGTFLSCVISDGFRSPLIRNQAPFDLIMANILQRPLMVLSTSIAQNLVPGGTVVLSGLLDSQTASIISTYRSQGLHLKQRFSIDGWTTLIMKRPQG